MKVKFHFLLQAILTRMEINLKLRFIFLIMPFHQSIIPISLTFLFCLMKLKPLLLLKK